MQWLPCLVGAQSIGPTAATGDDTVALAANAAASAVCDSYNCPCYHHSSSNNFNVAGCNLAVRNVCYFTRSLSTLPRPRQVVAVP
jgi:hypothetical protein